MGRGPIVEHAYPGCWRESFPGKCFNLEYAKLFLKAIDLVYSISSSLHPGSHEIASTHAPPVRHKNVVRKKLFFMVISFFGGFFSI